MNLKGAMKAVMAGVRLLSPPGGQPEWRQSWGS